MKKFDEYVNEGKVSTPIVEIKQDYDGFFARQVKSAIDSNLAAKIPMVHKIVINSGSYRNYDMSYERKKEADGTMTCNFDFYAASRVFGGDYTIKDVAKCIALTGFIGLN